MADDLGDLLVQLAHTTFTGVPVDDPLEHLIRQGDRVALHPVLLELFGQQVALGDPIAEVGQTGQTTGSHLHFELHQDTVYLNPIYYVQL